MDAAERLNTALEGRYHIERELGEGGMATVYLAEDLRHERKVALKVLKPELAAVVGAERFLAEIKTTANLQHPHILPLFDSGEADGLLFYVMPHVEGESLRDRLEREGQLPIDDAIRIAADISEALDYAHRQGVIHRDIKPANILMHDGQPMVSDFGIALALGSAGTGRLTETGLSVGSPHYMSPEQATADENVGPATDIYSLGCVIHEMLLGEPPFTGSTAQAVLGRIVAGEVPAMSARRKSIPEGLDSAVRKALEKIPADRFATGKQLVEALADSSYGQHARGTKTAWPSWLPWAAAVAGVAALSLWAVPKFFGPTDPSAATAVANEASVLVLPFEDLSPGADQGHFVAGLQGAIIGALAGLSGLDVPGRTSVVNMLEGGADVRAIASTFRAATLLEGTLQKDGDRVLVTAQHTDTRSGSVLWSDQYPGELTDLFRIQDDIVKGIAERFELTPTVGDDGRLVDDATDHPDAYEAYLRGVGLLEARSETSIRAAIAEFERALQLDSAYADAWSGLADAHNLIDLYVLDAEDVAFAENQGAALRYAERSVELDSTLYKARTSLGLAHFMRGGWDEARRQYELALSLNPGDAHLNMRFAQYLYSTGSAGESVRYAREAFRRDPAWPLMSYSLSIALHMARRTEEAIARGDETLQMAPDWPTSHGMLSMFYLVRGDYAEGTRYWMRYSEMAGLPNGPAEAWYQAAIRHHETGEPQPVTDSDPRILITDPRFRLTWASLGGDIEGYVDAFAYHVEQGALGWAAQAHAGSGGVDAYANEGLRLVLREHPRYQRLLQEAGITW